MYVSCAHEKAHSACRHAFVKEHGHNRWVHSHFMENTPDAMAGSARPLSDDECESRGVPKGTRTYYIYIYIYIILMRAHAYNKPPPRASTDEKNLRRNRV